MSGGTIQGGAGRGHLALRDHGSERRIEGRVVQYGAIVELLDARGQSYVRPEGQSWDSVGDLSGYALWKSASKSQRGISAISTAHSSVIASAGGGTTPPQLLPLRAQNTPDGRFSPKTPRLGSSPPGYSGLPAGTSGHLSAGMEERSQEDLFHPDWQGVIVAANLDSPQLGSTVTDLDAGGVFHPVRHAKLQSLLTVLDLTPGAPACGLKGRAIAINFGRGGKLDGGPGFALLADHDRAEYMALPSLLGGPLLGGVACQHGGQLGSDADGKKGFPAHLDVNALRLGNGGDGPQLFSAERWVEPDGDFGQWRRVHQRFNPVGLHKNGCVAGGGYWMWEVRTPTAIIEKPWVDPPPPEPPPPEDDRYPPPPGGGPKGDGIITGGGGLGGDSSEDHTKPPGGGTTKPTRPITGNTGRGFTGPGSGLSPDGGGFDLAGSGIPLDGDPIWEIPGGGGHTEEAPLPDPRPITGGTTPPPEGEPEGEATRDDPLDLDAVADELRDGLGLEPIPDGLEEELTAGLGEGFEIAIDNDLEPGAVDGEAPTGAHAAGGAFIPLYEYSTQCWFGPQYGLFGLTATSGGVAVGGADPEFRDKWLSETPLIGTTTGLALGPTSLAPGGILVASGGGVSHPVSASIVSIAGGYYDPLRGGNTIGQTYSDFYPGGLSDQYFSHPDPTTSTGAIGGVRVGQTADGLGMEWTVVDSSGDLDTGHEMTLNGSGLSVTGGLTVDGTPITGSGSGVSNFGGSGADGATTTASDSQFTSPLNATTYTLNVGISAYTAQGVPLSLKSQGAMAISGIIEMQGRGVIADELAGRGGRGGYKAAAPVAGYDGQTYAGSTPLAVSQGGQGGGGAASGYMFSDDSEDGAQGQAGAYRNAGAMGSAGGLPVGGGPGGVGSEAGEAGTAAETLSTSATWEAFYAETGGALAPIMGGGGQGGGGAGGGSCPNDDGSGFTWGSAGAEKTPTLASGTTPGSAGTGNAGGDGAGAGGGPGAPGGGAAKLECAGALTFGGSSEIDVSGADGGDGGLGGTGDTGDAGFYGYTGGGGGAGGGGGGGGGAADVAYGSVSGSPTQTKTGGTGGTGGAGGAAYATAGTTAGGAGGDGGDGEPGHIVLREAA